MPAAGRTVGRDLTLVIVDPNYNGGMPLAFPVIADSNFRQLAKRLQWIAMDGTNSYAEIPQGWEVSVTIDRADGSVMNYFVQTEANYFTGASTSQLYVSETITNPDGSTSQYRYVQGTAKLTDGGKFAGDDKVQVKIDMVFSRVQRIQ
jgi:hypothetical protein